MEDDAVSVVSSALPLICASWNCSQCCSSHLQ